jgi:C_GCAxxG_C_C family probable redox protein
VASKNPIGPIETNLYCGFRCCGIIESDGSKANRTLREVGVSLDADQAGRKSLELHEGGLNCAEAVLAGVLDATRESGNPLVPRIACCFGGGVGRSKEELCGALAGALMAMGCLVGRDRPGQPWDLAAEAAADLRKRFQALYGSTRCAEILAAMDPQQDGHACERLSGRTAALVCEMLKELGARTR